MLTKIFNTRFISKLNYQSYSKSGTIFALSSGFGKCGVAVVRISGPDSYLVLTEMAGFQDTPTPRKVFLREIIHPRNKMLLDKGLVIWFPGPKSFTGEDSCELQIHGGKAVVCSILSALLEINNFRPAEPGEFTKRAFYSGKLNLTEAEGLADLIDAETETQRRQAINQMMGSLSHIYNSWKESILDIVAKCEAEIDFGETELIDDDLMEDTHKSITNLLDIIKSHISDGRKGERLRDGVQTVIIGAPNVGKSSLLNAICRKEEAIVSSIAGTTRDVISSTLDIDGYPVVIKDTAGLREREGLASSLDESNSSSLDPIEREGISRAIGTVHSSDLVLLVIDPSFISPEHSPAQSVFNYCARLGIPDLIFKCNNKLIRKRQLEPKGETVKKCLIIMNKIDLFPTINLDDFDAAISCKTGNGIDHLIHVLSSTLNELCGNGSFNEASCNQMRHKYCLNEVISSLETCLSVTETDLLAHHLRQALHSLGKITGEVKTDQILDVIFKRFCIGK